MKRLLASALAALAIVTFAVVGQPGAANASPVDYAISDAYVECTQVDGWTYNTVCIDWYTGYGPLMIVTSGYGSTLLYAAPFTLQCWSGAAAVNQNWYWPGIAWSNDYAVPHTSGSTHTHGWTHPAEDPIKKLYSNTNTFTPINSYVTPNCPGIGAYRMYITFQGNAAAGSWFYNAAQQDIGLYWIYH